MYRVKAVYQEKVKTQRVRAKEAVANKKHFF